MTEHSNPLGDAFGPDATSDLPDAELRRRAAEIAARLGLPTVESEEWRYSPITDLDLSGLTPVTRPVNGSVVDPLDGSTRRAATVRVIDGWVSGIDGDPGWFAKGLEVASTSAPFAPSDLDGEESFFDALHTAFTPGRVRIDVPAGLEVTDPIVILHHHRGERSAVFPHVTVHVGSSGGAQVVEYHTSAGPGLAVPRVDVDIEDGARLVLATIQDLHPDTVQIAGQRATVGAQATFASAHGAFGGRYARLRTDTRLEGRAAHGELTAAYFGDGHQILDFRPFQHHVGADSSSNLTFKGAVDGESSSIYTGLIHIHPDARGSNAHQTNRNITLSNDAWAWSVPNLEIENNDVRCSHASTVSPIEADQRFYLAARGVPPTVADRLIISGFFADLVERMPTLVQPAITALVEAKLSARLDRDAEERS